MPKIDVEIYRNLFTFPVKDYYEAIGFNFEQEDFEVATGLGVDCILVANGHQSRKRLLQVTSNVISSVEEITTFFY